MTITKKYLLVLFCVCFVTNLVLPVYAVDARLSHGVFTDMLFGITDAGLAEVSVDYEGNGTSFISATVETYIQKRSLGFIWTKVDNGEVNKTWIDTSTERVDYFVHHLQLEETGTYRAVIKITFSGTGAEDDVITEKLTAVYE